MSKPVRVQIYDQSYLIGGDLEEAYVRETSAKLSTGRCANRPSAA